MDGTKEAKKHRADPPKPAADLVRELEASRSEFETRAQEARAKAASAGEELSARYWETVKDIARKAEQAWIESYVAYLDAYMKLPADPDDAALEAVRDAWAAHVAACTWAPGLVEAWTSAHRTMLGDLQDIESTAAVAITNSTEGYTKNFRATLSRRGLDSLDLPAAQFIIQQIAALNAAAAR